MKQLLLAGCIAGALATGLVAATVAHAQQDEVSRYQAKRVGVVYFAVDSDEIDAEAKKVLDPLKARALADTKHIVILVHGHTEPNEAGNGPEYGMGLSQRRASNVRAYLYPDSYLDDHNESIMQSFGESQPPADGGNARRVEIYFGNFPGS